jgi:hypothetical protein
MIKIVSNVKCIQCGDKEQLPWGSRYDLSCRCKNASSISSPMIIINTDTGEETNLMDLNNEELKKIQPFIHTIRDLKEENERLNEEIERFEDSMQVIKANILV